MHPACFIKNLDLHLSEGYLTDNLEHLGLTSPPSPLAGHPLLQGP